MRCCLNKIFDILMLCIILLMCTSWRIVFAQEKSDIATTDSALSWFGNGSEEDDDTPDQNIEETSNVLYADHIDGSENSHVDLSSCSWFISDKEFDLDSQTSFSTDLLFQWGEATSSAPFVIKRDTFDESFTLGTVFSVADNTLSTTESYVLIVSCSGVSDLAVSINGEKNAESVALNLPGTIRDGGPTAYLVKGYGLKNGQNLLLIKCKPCGRSDVIISNPFTLTYACSFVMKADTMSKQALTSPSVSAQLDREKLAITKLFDKETSDLPTLRHFTKAEQPLQGNPFAYFNPSVGMITPTALHPQTAPPVIVMLDRISSCSLLQNMRSEYYKVAVDGESHGTKVDYVLYSNTHFPGGIFEIEPGTIFPIQIKFNNRHGLIQVLQNNQMEALLEGGKKVSGTMLFVADSAETSPFLIVFKDAAYNLTRNETTVDFTVIPDKGKRGFAHIIYPYGTSQVKLPLGTESLTKTVSLLNPDKHVSETLADWLSLAVHFPVSSNEFYAVKYDSDVPTTLTVFQTTQYFCPSDLTVALPKQWVPNSLTKSAVQENICLPQFSASKIFRYDQDPVFFFEKNNSFENINVACYDVAIPNENFNQIPMISNASYIREVEKIVVLKETDYNRSAQMDLFSDCYSELMTVCNYNTKLSGYARKRINVNFEDWLSSSSSSKLTDGMIGDWGRSQDFALNAGKKLYGLGGVAHFWGKEKIPNDVEPVKELLTHIETSFVDEQESQAPLALYAGASAAYFYFSLTNQDDDLRDRAAYAKTVAYLHYLAHCEQILKNIPKMEQETVLKGIVDCFYLSGVFIEESFGLMPSSLKNRFSTMILMLKSGLTKSLRSQETLTFALLKLKLNIENLDAFLRLYGLQTEKSDLSKKALLLSAGLREFADLFLLDWGSCEYLGYSVHEFGDNYRYEIQFNNREKLGCNVRFGATSKPLKIQINEKPVPLTNWKYKDGILSVKLLTIGMNEIELIN